MKQDQYRSSGGAGPEGSYGPTAGSSSSSSNEGPQPISRTTGGAGVEGSYGPTAAMDNSNSNNKDSSSRSSGHEDNASPVCYDKGESSPTSATAVSKAQPDGPEPQAGSSSSTAGSKFFKKLSNLGSEEDGQGQQQQQQGEEHLRSKL